MAIALTVGLAACGLDAQGLLVPLGTDGGPEGVVPDAGSVDDSEDGASGGAHHDAAKPRDGSVPNLPADASSDTPASRDADAGLDLDAAEASVASCSDCFHASCPSQVAACGQGSECDAYRICQLGCSSQNSSSCSNTCGAMYPNGQSAFGAVTLCGFACGAGCIAVVSVTGF
jgi:hypothetical protein